MRDVDDLIYELFEEPVADDEKIVFTSRSVELIHEIAERCNEIPMVKDTQGQAADYAKDLTAEEIYVDMLLKIVEAPTRIHMRMSARMLIPILDKKLRGEGA